MHGRERGIVQNGPGSTGTCDLMRDILCDLGIAKPHEIIMHRDALAEGLMHRAAQDAVEVRFPAEYEREAVQRVIPVVHQHFYVIQDARGQVLRFIDRKNYKVPID